MWTVISQLISFDEISKHFETWKDRDRIKSDLTQDNDKDRKSSISDIKKEVKGVLPLGNGSWIFLQTFQWEKRNESRRSLQRHAFFNWMYNKDSLLHYIADLGVLHFFSIYQNVCGVSVENNVVSLSWKTLEPYLCDTYHHADVFRCRRLTKQKIDVVKVSVVVEEHAVGHDFETKDGQIRMQAFSTLVRKLVPLPSVGEQFMCYVKGDVYLTGILKYFFIRQVFNDRGVRLGRSEYEDMQRRLTSCKRLQEGFDVSIDAFSLQLAEAGYFLTNDDKLAQCFKCGGVLQLKKFDFDPWEDHAYWHPSCPFLLETRGQEFVDKVRQKLKQRCNFNSECVFTFRLRQLAPVSPPIRGAIPDIDSSDDFDDDEMGEDSDDYFGSESPESDYFSDDELF